jgi:hypothetical protein
MDLTKRSLATEFKPGDILSRISYFRLKEKVSETGQWKVENMSGFEWRIAPPILEEECYAADQFSRQVTLEWLIVRGVKYVLK